MQSWILEANSGVRFLPTPNGFVIHLSALGNVAASTCQIEPGSQETAFLLHRIRAVQEEGPQELTFGCSSRDAIIHHEQENYTCTVSLPTFLVPALWLSLTHISSTENKIWCGFMLHFNSADIFPAEALISSRISSPFVPRN